MSTKRDDKDERKKEFIFAAMLEVAQKGLNNVTIDHIAVSAGIGKGTVYEYFSSKEEIFGAAMAEFMGQIEAIQARKLFRATTPPEKLKAILDSWVEVSETLGYEFMKLTIDIWAEGIRQGNPELSEVMNIKQVYYEYREIVSAIINDGINGGIFNAVDTKTVAGIFLATVDGLLIQWLIDRESMDIRKTADMLFQTVMQGISIK